jgi:RimJ/RimL family protein N-acetyltransferase
MEIDLVPFDIFFLDYTWKWLNDPEIQKLTSSYEFSREEQKQWFERLKDRVDYLIWGVTYSNIPIGACGLKNIKQDDCEYWGYIGEKQYWGKGLGKEILKFMIDEAISMNLSSVWLKVISINLRAVKLYTNSGFVIENEDNNYLFMRKYLIK